MPRISRAACLLLLAASATAAQTPADTLDFSEVPPELAGGLQALQQSVVYPDADRTAGVEGRVIVRFVVRADGTAGAAEVARSVSPRIDAAAVAAITAARFRPGTQGGVAVAVRMVLPVTFRLDVPPPRRALDADALLGRLGRTWSDAHLAEPDAVEPVGAGQRMVWHAPDAETERITADVSRDTLRVITVTARPGAPPSSASRLRSRPSV